MQQQLAHLTGPEWICTISPAFPSTPYQPSSYSSSTPVSAIAGATVPAPLTVPHGTRVRPLPPCLQFIWWRPPQGSLPVSLLQRCLLLLPLPCQRVAVLKGTKLPQHLVYIKCWKCCSCRPWPALWTALLSGFNFSSSVATPDISVPVRSFSLPL